MPIVVIEPDGLRMISRPEQICQMSMVDLIALEKYLWNCMDNKIPAPAIVDMLNQIYREVEWRAQDAEDT